MKKTLIFLLTILPGTMAHALPFQLTFSNTTSPVTFSGAVPAGFDVNNVTVGFSFDNGGTSGINQSGNFADITEAFIQSGSYSTTWTPSTPGWFTPLFVSYGTDGSGFLSTPGVNSVDIRVNAGQDGVAGSNQPIISITGPNRVANPNLFNITFSNGSFASPPIAHNGGTPAVPEPSSLSLCLLLGVAGLGLSWRKPVISPVAGTLQQHSDRR